jgi:hypothetical protein
MKINKILILFLLFALLLSSFVVDVKTNIIHTDTIPKDILLIVEDPNEPKILEVLETYPDISCDIATSEDITIKEIENYYEIAVPYGLVDNRIKSILRKAYSENKKIYLYGELTINDYKEVLDLGEFGKHVDIYNTEQKKLDKKVFLSFDEEYQKVEKHNVVALSKDEEVSGLLASVPILDNKSVLIKAVLDDVIPHSSIATSGAECERKGFDVKTYAINGSYAALDWLLYQDTNETSLDYDYFAIKTQTKLVPWYVGEHGTRIDVNHKEYRSSDEIVDAQPQDTESRISFDVNLNLKSNESSYELEMSSRPDIDLTISLSSDYAKWVCDGAYLEGDTFVPSSSWASVASYEKAGRKLELKGYFYDNIGDMETVTPLKTVTVTYSY